MPAWTRAFPLVLCLAPILLNPTNAAAVPDQVALFELVVDGDSKGPALIVRDGGRDWVAVEALEAAGLRGFAGHRKTIDGALRVDLSSLAPTLDYRLDGARLVLELSTQPPSAERIAASHDRVVLVTVEVDGIPAGETLLIYRGRELWIGAESLEATSAAGVRGTRRSIDGGEYVELSSLQPQVQADFDAGRSRLSLSTMPANAVAHAPGHDRVALFELRVDGTPQGLLLVVRTEGEDFVSVESLESSGVPPFAGRRRTVDGSPYVSLSSLPPRVSYRIDDEALILRIDTAGDVVRAPPSGFDQVGLFALEINGTAAGDVLVTRDGRNAWVAVDELGLSGLGGFAGDRALIADSECVELGSLDPGIVYQLDDRAMRLRLSARPEFLLGGYQVAILDLVVNEQRIGETRALLRGKDVRIPVASLERAGLRGFTGDRAEAEGEPYVVMASLAPGIAYEFDEPALLLTLNARPEFFPSSRRNVASNRPADLIYTRDNAAFVNYSLAVSDNEQVNASAETGVNVAGGLFTSTFSRDSDGLIRRNASSVTYDDRRHLVRWQAGDRYASSGGLGGSVNMGGIGFSRNYGIDPYYVHTPTMDFTGVADTRSTVELYVDGRLVHKEEVPAGTFDLENVLLQSGHGDARMVIRDAFGREREMNTSYYSSGELLGKGQQQYSYSLGLIRKPYRAPTAGAPFEPVGRDDEFQFAARPLPPPAIELGEYGEPAFVGRHQFGVTRWLTASAHLEGTRELGNTGASLSAALPFGQVGMSGALSALEDGTSGAAASIGYGYSTGWLNTGVAGKVTSPEYATLSLRATQDRSLLDLGAYARVRVGSIGNVAVQHGRSSSRFSGISDRTTVSASTSFLKRFHLSLSGSNVRREGAPDVLTVSAGLSAHLGRGTSANLSHQQTGEFGSTELGIQKSPPAGTGYGYRLRFRDDVTNGDDPGAPPGVFGAGPGPESASGVVTYQNRYGRYELSSGASGGSQGGSLRAAGALVAVGGGVYASRPVEQSFALVRVPGVGGVRVLASNREVGRTNRNGNLLVPNMLSYYGNRLGIMDEDIPIDYRIMDTDMTVAPPNRGAAVVIFPVRRILAITGTALLEDGGKAVPPSYGELTVSVDGVDHTSPVGKNGEFYFENLPAGKHTAVLRFRGQTARFVLAVPADADRPVVDIGTVRGR